MNVLLPDTSVLVDLERGEILETIFCYRSISLYLRCCIKWNSRTAEERP